MSNNETLKQIMTEKGVKHWKVADVLNIHENTLCRRLRRPVSPQFAEAVLSAIETVAGQENS